LNKKTQFNPGKRLDFPYHESEFKCIRPYEQYEIEPILSRLFRKNMAEHPDTAELLLSDPKRYNRHVNDVLTMYIIIRNVSALEYYLRQVASKIVDNDNNNKSIDFSKFFTYDFETEFAKANQKRGTRRRKKLTKGQAFASQFDFVNPGEIDWVFTRLLGKKFFVSIKKINPRAGEHPWKCRRRSRGLVKNWKNFMKMFEQRNEIVHLMKRIRLNKEELCYLCNNTRMFMEQANVLVYGALQGGNAEQNFFHGRITEQEKLRREELARSSKPSKRKKKTLRRKI